MNIFSSVIKRSLFSMFFKKRQHLLYFFINPDCWVFIIIFESNLIESPFMLCFLQS